MARAYQCDRCMQYYTENKDVRVPNSGSTKDIMAGATIFGKQANSAKATYELCDTCCKELTDWLAFRKILVPNNDYIKEDK